MWKKWLTSAALITPISSQKDIRTIGTVLQTKFGYFVIHHPASLAEKVIDAEFYSTIRIQQSSQSMRMSSQYFNDYLTKPLWRQDRKSHSALLPYQSIKYTSFVTQIMLWWLSAEIIAIAYFTCRNSLHYFIIFLDWNYNALNERLFFIPAWILLTQ